MMLQPAEDGGRIPDPVSGSGSRMDTRLSDQIWLQDFKNLVNILLRMDAEVDRLGKIQTEDTHNGLGVDHISAGYQIKVIIELGNIIDKGLYLVDRIERNLYCFHRFVPPYGSV
jgi:hypothetical protein